MMALQPLSVVDQWPSPLLLKPCPEMAVYYLAQNRVVVPLSAALGNNCHDQNMSETRSSQRDIGLRAVRHWSVSHKPLGQ
jgi:hypothetical protein